MLIMTYAHARASGDGNMIGKYVRTKLYKVLAELTKLDSIIC
jgi:hypothetical protein